MDVLETVYDVMPNLTNVNKVLAERPFANGATYSTGGSTTNCYAEFGMTGPNDSSAWQTCAFPSSVGICEFRQGDGTGGRDRCKILAHGAEARDRSPGS